MTINPFGVSRREFIAFGGASALASPAGGAESKPWHQRVRRIGQVNFSEHDVVDADIEGWADYWAEVKVDAVQINVTGMIAFYPTEVPFHKRSRYLNNRDFFGECCRAAKIRGIRVIARFSPDLQWEDALNAHPEWFLRDRDGRPVPPFSRTPGLYQTCMFSPYYSEQTPAIMREVNARYDVDGLYANGWPNWHMPVCYCDVCRTLPKPGSMDYHERFMARAIEIWTLYDEIAKEKSPENLFFGNLGGGYRTGVNIWQLAEKCGWFNADNQGRSGASPSWGASQQGRVAQAVMKGKTITNVTGGWSTGSPMWRNATKNPAEAEMWLAQTAASGMAVWYHWLGAQTGLGEDRRWQETGRKFLKWHARHNSHFVNKRSIANVGLVMGQRTQTFYQPPGDGHAGDHVEGYYAALLDARHTFEFVHEDDLSPVTLRKFDVLILPNVALMSDAQCRQIEAYVAAGGSVMADFETSLFDERGRERADFGLARLFGMSKSGRRVGSRGFENSFYARIERAHEILRGFTGTNWTAGCEWRIPVKIDTPPVMTAVGPYPAYPTEVVYTEQMRTNEPALVLREIGPSRLVYFPGDIGRTFWRSGHQDPLRLISNGLDWMLRGRRPLAVAGDGLVELFAWETRAGFAIHLLNMNNPALHRASIQRHSPIGPQRVRFQMPDGAPPVKRVELLRAGAPISFAQKGRTVAFTVPKVVDYEVAAIV